MFESGYIGGKASAGVYHRIIGNMPPHSVYVEPFFGSGAVFWHKRRAEKNIVIDRRADLIAKIDAETGVNAICGDALSILPTLTLPADAVVYCDPPYVLSTRKNRRYYEFEMSDDEHEHLLKILTGFQCRVILSGYRCELYGSYLQNWRCEDFKFRARGKTTIETLWCNFPEPVELHDWRYAGKNFRERLTLNRLAARAIARIERMPARKRGYILHALREHLSGSSRQI